MNYWLLKSEPSDYSFADLLRDKRTVWDGVRNNQALMFLRTIRKGDRAFLYHSGKDKHIAGIADVVRGAYPDPKQDDEKLVVIDVKVREALPEPVTLAAIKADKAFADLHLVRISRLSVMPVSAEHWTKLCGMGGLG